MANIYGRTRKDANSKRSVKKYSKSYDESGKIGTENKVIKAFWRVNKMADIINLSSKQIDAMIQTFLEKYEAKQIKQDRNWWYPEVTTLAEIRAKKRLDKEKEQ